MSQKNSLVISELMLPGQANPSGNVHGGEIMKMMDSTAYALAHKYAKSNVVTVRVDELQFHQPIFIGDLVTCKAHIVFVGHSSMEIDVQVVVEDIEHDGKPEPALSAFFTMVALDRNGRPLTVQPLLLETDEEREAFEAGRKRYEHHKEVKRRAREAQKARREAEINKEVPAANEERLDNVVELAKK